MCHQVGSGRYLRHSTGTLVVGVLFGHSVPAAAQMRTWRSDRQEAANKRGCQNPR